MSTSNWSRDELILAFNLYCKIPVGRIHTRNPQIIALAKILKRTPSAVSLKLSNFASLDPALKARHVGGMTHGSKLDAEVWNEFTGDWDRLAFESERLLARMTDRSLQDVANIDYADLPKEGKERRAVVKLRVNQSFFRQTVLAAYDGRCCITGLHLPELLIASHIVPWASDNTNRVNPRNGLCLNALHDRAFDAGLITVTPDFNIEVSRSVRSSTRDLAVATFLLRFDGHKIRLPDKFAPDPAFLAYHYHNVFRPE